MNDQMTGTVSDLVTECRQCGRPLMRCECCEECATKDAEIARLQLDAHTKDAFYGEEIARLREIEKAARGLACGEDWNNGTHAKTFRPRLIMALQDNSDE